MATYDSVSRNVPLLEVRGLQRSFYGIRAPGLTTVPAAALRQVAT